MKFIFCFLLIIPFSCLNEKKDMNEKKVIITFLDNLSKGKFEDAKKLIVIKDEISLSNENLEILQNALTGNCKQKIITQINNSDGKFKKIENTNLECIVYQINVPKSCYDTSKYSDIFCLFGFEKKGVINKIIYYYFENGHNLMQIPKTPVKIRNIFDDSDSL